MDVTFSYTAIKYDNIDVFGYTAWSLLDGFEWQHAYNIRRGLFYVDFKSEKKERIPKSSALYYRQIIRENGFFPRESTPSLQAQFSCDFSWGITESVLKVRVKYWEDCWRQSYQQLYFVNKWLCMAPCVQESQCTLQTEVKPSHNCIGSVLCTLQVLGWANHRVLGAPAAADPTVGALPRLAGPPSPSLCLHLHVADQIREFQTKKLTPTDCSWVIFQPGEFPNPVRSVTTGMPATVWQRVAQGRDKVVTLVGAELPAGLRSRLKLLNEAETDSWVELECHLRQVGNKPFFKKTYTTGKDNQHQHIYLLPPELTFENATYRLFSKLVCTAPISTLNVVDKLTICIASVGILFSSLHTER